MQVQLRCENPVLLTCLSPQCPDSFLLVACQWLQRWCLCRVSRSVSISPPKWTNSVKPLANTDYAIAAARCVPGSITPLSPCNCSDLSVFPPLSVRSVCTCCSVQKMTMHLHRHIVELNTTSCHVVTEHFRRLQVGTFGNHPGNATWDHWAVHHYLTKSKCDVVTYPPCRMAYCVSSCSFRRLCHAS